MRWKKRSDFIVALMLSIGYFYVTFLNLIWSFHSPVIYVQGSTAHPLISLLYLAIALAITWIIYCFAHDMGRRKAFFTAIAAGIVIITIGIFLWRVEVGFFDTVDDNIPVTSSQTTDTGME